MVRGKSRATCRQTFSASATASVPTEVRDSVASPSRRARSTYLASDASVCSRTRSTSSTPFMVAESMTPTEMKTKFLKWPGKSCCTESRAWMPRPPYSPTSRAAVGASWSSFLGGPAACWGSEFMISLRRHSLSCTVR